MRIMSIIKSLIRPEVKNTEGFVLLDVKDYKNAVMNKAVQLVDVRTPVEYKNGHLAKAINIDYHDKSSFFASFEKLDKEKPLYIYCRSGQRSRSAAKQLLQRGFKQIFDLKGGLNNWQ